MTDSELIELVQTKTPPELTESEVAELCARLPQCPALQEALAEHLEMERYLADALGRVNISPEKILVRAGQALPDPRRSLRRWAALALLLGGVLVITLVWRLGGAKRTDATGSEAVAVLSPSTLQRATLTTAPPTTARPPDTAPPKTAPPEEPPPATVEPPRNTAAEPLALVDMREPGLNEAQLKAWFDPVEGQPHGFRTVPPAYLQAPSTEMTGLWRLRPAWKAGAALRCLFRTVNTFKLHLWNGTDGLTLELWRAANRYPYLPDLSLVAYRTTRKGKEPRPDTLILIGADEGEFWRTRTQIVPSGYPRLAGTPMDLRHEDGLLTVSCGDVRILSVPWAALPAEVYFEGEASFQSLGVAPLVPLPPEPAPLPAVLDVSQPAGLTWLGDRDHLTDRADGGVELRALKPDRRSTVAAVLPPRGICEVLVQLEGVTPGTGVYLGDDKGQVRYAVSFLRDEPTGRTIALETGPTENLVNVRFSPATRWPPAFVSNRVWLRLLNACGQLKCWVSSDGAHWARAFESPAGRPAETWASVGLFCQPGEPQRALRLRRLMLRELSTLSALAPAELVQQAPLVPHTLYSSLGEWLASVHAFRPPEVDTVVWTRACALRALAGGISPPQGQAIIENLLDHALEQDLPFEVKLRLIDEAMMLVPKSQATTGQRFVRYYERLGQTLHQKGEARPYSRLRQALYHSPLWTPYVVDVFPESLAATEMLDLAAAGQWEDAEAVARFGRIHRASPSLFDSSETAALPRDGPKRPARLLRGRWSPTMLLEQDKDGTSDLGEIEAACRAGSFREAARIITRLKPRGDRGLLPDSGDMQRLTSWPVALGGLFETHGDLRTLLRGEFAPEGRLQLRRALDEKDELGLAALTLRYFSTEEAAEAHLWLGDRRLADGEPALAVGEYRQALRMAEGALRRRIEDRLHLTAALLGQPVAAAPTAEVTFGDTHLDPAMLQALRRKRSDEGVESRWTVPLPPQPAPAPSAFDVMPRGRFEGELGEKPEVVPVPPATRRQLNIDWFARQAALAVDGNRLLVSNRFQVACYEIPTGKLLWRTALSREAAHKELPAGAFEYFLTPMRPVLAGPRLYVRRLLRGPPPGPNQPPPAVATLACLESAGGKVLWSTTNHLTGRLHYVADPLVIQDQVFAVGHKQSVEGDWALFLLIHNRSDGTLLAERPLCRVRSSFDEQRSCQLTALEDSCLATVGGSVLCFDLAGNLRWARRPMWVPPEADVHWMTQPHEPPLVAGDRCFIVQPGVLNLVCLAPTSGKQLWQKAIFGLQRLTGLVDGRLIVQTDTGFVCLDAAAGKEQWRHETGPVLSSLCGGPGGLMYVTLEHIPGEKELYRPLIVWVDPETGREKTRFALDGLRQQQPMFPPRLGPLFVAGDRLWTFTGKANELTRDLVELVPGKADLAATAPPTEWDLWTRTVPAPLRSAAARVLPGWTVFESKVHINAGLLAEHHGQRDVFCAPAPFAVGRHLDVPDTSKPRLRLRLCRETRGLCRIAVDVNGKRLLAEDVPAALGQWKEWDVDLSAFKGQRMWIVVRQPSPEAMMATVCWGKIELVE